MRESSFQTRGMENCSGVSSHVESGPGPLKAKRRRSLAQRVWDKERSKTRVNIGLAFPRWSALKAEKGFQFDADVASFLLDEYEKGPTARTPSETTLVQVPASELSCRGASVSECYLLTKSESRLERQTVKKSSSTETCESVHYEYPIMSSPNEAEWEIGAAPSVQSSDEEKESGNQNDAWSVKGPTEWATKQPKNKENTDIKEKKVEEFRTSLRVRDECYVVDLGSSSEFIVDEECILQLFRTCRECNSRCTVKKHIKGLKLVVFQTCGFCQNHYKWTNLPGDNEKEDSDFQVNGKGEASVQTNTAVLPNRNTS